MERAHAPHRIAGAARQGDVTDLGVQRAGERLAVYDETAADAGAHGHVGERADASSGAPLPLGAGGRIDVGVDRHGHGEPRGELGAQIRSRPARLGSAEDATVVRRRPIAHQRPEGGHADRREPLPGGNAASDEGGQLLERGLRRGGGPAPFRQSVASRIDDPCQDLRTPRLDRCPHRVAHRWMVSVSRPCVALKWCAAPAAGAIIGARAESDPWSAA